ncbi:hypothetical protein CRM22_005674 [Opisthorchis felineus]|uniref:Uncharacterized protein n=1 Tax=Opisthorchis felineus TaxID=147828 RepID=A0A4S2LQ17_OPIFE|nr:hypothetical protein CRM22_005674 [Opisthorchis felineus]
MAIIVDCFLLKDGFKTHVGHVGSRTTADCGICKQHYGGALLHTGRSTSSSIQCNHGNFPRCMCSQSNLRCLWVCVLMVVAAYFPTETRGWSYQQNESRILLLGLKFASQVAFSQSLEKHCVLCCLQVHSVKQRSCNP